MVEFRRVEDTADQNEQLLAHLSEHLSHFLTARLKTMELYPFLYDFMNTNLRKHGILQVYVETFRLNRI
jgi:hypothetical protein